MYSLVSIRFTARAMPSCPPELPSAPLSTPQLLKASRMAQATAADTIFLNIASLLLFSQTPAGERGAMPRKILL